MIERDIVAELLADCSRHHYGKCSTLGCLRKGGWERGDGSGYDKAACTEWAASAEILRLRDVVSAQRQIIAEQRAQIDYETDLCAQVAANDAQIAALMKVKEAAEQANRAWKPGLPEWALELSAALAAYNKEHPDGP